MSFNLELWRKIKKEKHLTIDEIAKRANLPKGSVQNIFCGYVPNPRIDTVQAIENALGIFNRPAAQTEQPKKNASKTSIDFGAWKKAKKEKGLSYDDLAEITGYSRSTIISIFLGHVDYPRHETVVAIESALGLSPRPIVDTTERAKTFDANAEIIGTVDLSDNNPIPLLGSVAAGVPIESQEDIEGYIYVNYRPREEYFALRVHGESMIGAGIKDNSILIVHKQAWAESGEIVVAMLNGKQTVKRLKCYGKGKNFLMPENPAFEPVPILEGDDLIILGKVVEMRVTF